MNKLPKLIITVDTSKLEMAMLRVSKAAKKLIEVLENSPHVHKQTEGE